MSDVSQRLSALVGGFDARVQAAPADSWTNPAPCEGWTARDVVLHVGNNLLSIGGALQGTELAPIADDEDAPSGWGRARDAITAGLATGDLSQNLPGPMGPMPAEQLLGQFVSMDVLVHTWDLARAVGGDESLPAEVCAQAHSGLKPMDAMIRRPGVFGPKVDCADDADEQTKFLSFLGRTV